MSHNVYRDGYVYVRREMCSSCIFRPGNLMELRSGRVKGMIHEAIEGESTIVCHQTLDGDNAACRGFVDRFPTPPLRLAYAVGCVREVDA